MFSKTLPVLLLLLLLSPTNAFDESLIAGTYNLLIGNCATPLTISRNSTQLPSSTLSLNNTSCNGSSLTLTSNPSNPTPLQIFLKEASQISSFLTTSQNLTCGNATISTLTLLTPSDKLTLPSILSPSAELNAEYVYLLTNRCIYSRRKPDNDGIVQQILDTVTECLPADALISTPTGLIPVAKLPKNAEVHTTAGVQRVFAWTHADATAKASFTTIELGSHVVAVTPGHYVHADGRLLPAAAVKIGMRMHAADEDLVVTRVGEALKTGLYNPQTPAGDLLLGQRKIRVSCYTTAVEPLLAHALLAPVRGAAATGFGGVVANGVEWIVERVRPVVVYLRAASSSLSTGMKL